MKQNRSELTLTPAQFRHLACAFLLTVKETPHRNFLIERLQSEGTDMCAEQNLHTTFVPYSFWRPFIDTRSDKCLPLFRPELEPQENLMSVANVCLLWAMWTDPALVPYFTFRHCLIIDVAESYVRNAATWSESDLIQMLTTILTVRSDQ